MVERYGADVPVLVWRDRLSAQQLGSRFQARFSKGALPLGFQVARYSVEPLILSPGGSGSRRNKILAFSISGFIAIRPDLSGFTPGPRNMEVHARCDCIGL